jgi:hypothetical protein
MHQHVQNRFNKTNNLRNDLNIFIKSHQIINLIYLIYYFRENNQLPDKKKLKSKSPRPLNPHPLMEERK